MLEDESETQKSWDSLKNAIQEIQKKNYSDLSFGELYSDAYTMVSYNCGDMLYNGVREVVSDHLVQVVHADVLASRASNFLETLNEVWHDHQACMVLIQNVLLYLDRTYVQRNNVDCVFDLGLIIFRHQIVLDDCIRDHLTETLLHIVMRERRRGMVDRSLTQAYSSAIAIKNACQMLISLGINSRSVYEDVFERPFLTQSTAFYREESHKFLEQYSVSVYMNKPEQWIKEETEFARRYLQKSTKELIVKVIKEEVISKQIETIIEKDSGVVYMLRNGETEALASVYKVFTLVEHGLKKLVECVSAYLREHGKTLVTKEEGGPVTLVRSLLDLKERFDHFQRHSFNGDLDFEQTITEDFMFVFKLNPKLPEYLSLFVNYHMRKGETEQQIEEVLDKTIELFKYLEDKDVFETYYREHLTKRLLFDGSVSDDSEKYMVSKLKEECGESYTSKLERMFRDMYASSVLKEEFKAHVTMSGVSLSNVDLNVRVLTTAIWPLQTDTQDCILPVAPCRAFEAFKLFYSAKYRSSRILKLHPQCCSVDMNAFFSGPKKGKVSQYILQVSTHQMCILMLFNSKEKWTYEEISKETNIPKKYLDKDLRALTLASHSILIKTPKTKEFDAANEFAVNDSFSSKRRRVKIQVVAAKADSDPERRETLKKVSEDRKFEVDAAIMRIMKARKRINHTDLVNEVGMQLISRFRPNPAVIKSRVEFLIHKEFLARTPEDRKIYVYI